jgi:DNA helicase-2/ATP-dependent DNA helicase PcrA
VLRRDGEAIGISRRFVIYDTDDQTALMKQVLREEDLPLTGEFRPSIVLGAISRGKNELDPTFLAENAANHCERTIARLAPLLERLRSARRSISTTCCSRRCGCSRRRRTPPLPDRWHTSVDEYQDTNRAQYLWVNALARSAQPRRRR